MTDEIGPPLMRGDGKGKLLNGQCRKKRQFYWDNKSSQWSLFLVKCYLLNPKGKGGDGLGNGSVWCFHVFQIVNIVQEKKKKGSMG